MALGGSSVEGLVNLPDPAFWRDRRVLVTGHTGFKGAWLSLWLTSMGAEVHGFALEPQNGSLFNDLELTTLIQDERGDVRDLSALNRSVARSRPEIVVHMAAQSLVRASYDDPVGTWSTNVTGTANLLQAIRDLAPLRCAIVIVTSDKVYENLETDLPYGEDARLGGHDPYSSSKAACEILASSWSRSFSANAGWRLATARSGNVIGGGDWAADRLLPDLARAFGSGETLHVRNPDSTRPWQHVLDPLCAYLLLAEQLFAEGVDTGSCWNFGPEPRDGMRVHEVLETAQRHWPGEVEIMTDPNAAHEAGKLALAVEKAKGQLGWRPRWDFETSVGRTVAWYRRHSEGASAWQLCRSDLEAFVATN